jgi:hypothetical protein
MSISFNNAPAKLQTKTTIFKASDFSFTSNASITSGTYTPIVSKTFTPTLTNADIFVEVFASYNVNGSGDDSWYSNITWNGNEIGHQWVQFNASTGSAARSSALFPVAGVWYNINTNPYTLAVNAKRGTSDDTLTVYADNSFYVKITEVAR